MFYARAGLSANPFPSLLAIDVLVAFATWNSRCPHCGGRLDQAHYPRKPRGAAEAHGLSEHQVRFSFCCGQEGCRRRLTPFSVRFLGRKVHFGAVVVLLSALRNGRQPWTVRRIVETFDPYGEGGGPSARTVLRWVAFWRERVVGSPFWRRYIEGVPPVATWALRHGSRELEERTPWSWLASLGLPPTTATLVRCLEWCAPLTSVSAPGSLAV